MSVNCVSATCRRRIDEHWAFCPYCGTDNRHPSQRKPIDPHRHQYLHHVGCCVICGETYDEPYQGMSGRARIRVGVLVSLFGFLLLLASINALLASLNIWAIAGNALRDSFRSHPVLSLAIWVAACIVGLILIFVGIRLLQKVRTDLDDVGDGCGCVLGTLLEGLWWWW